MLLVSLFRVKENKRRKEGERNEAISVTNEAWGERGEERGKTPPLPSPSTQEEAAPQTLDLTPDWTFPMNYCKKPARI